MGKKKRPQGLEVQLINNNEGTQMNTTTQDEQVALIEGEQQQAEGAETTPDEQGTIILGEPQEEEIIAFDGTGDVPSTQYDAEHPEPEGEQQEAQPAAKVGFGIGQFARWMLLNTDKTNAEILALTLKVFPDANTTAACIAWYKSDLRKKKLLPSVSGRSKGNVVEFSEDELKALLK